MKSSLYPNWLPPCNSLPSQTLVVRFLFHRYLGGPRPNFHCTLVSSRAASPKERIIRIEICDRAHNSEAHMLCSMVADGLGYRGEPRSPCRGRCWRHRCRRGTYGLGTKPAANRMIVMSGRVLPEEWLRAQRDPAQRDMHELQLDKNLTLLDAGLQIEPIS